MRKALNENPVVQLSAIAALLLIAGVFIAPQLLKKDEPPPDDPSAVEVGVSVNRESVGAVSIPTTPPAGATATPAAPVTSGTVTPEALIPGPGLPKNVIAAYEGGKTVVLLLIRNSGVDDRLVRGAVEQLSSDPALEVFVAPAKDVARYSRITRGVGVNRVPALVVVRPVEVSGEAPEAFVSYGFRDQQSVVQAVRDAAYEGPENRPYHPG